MEFDEVIEKRKSVRSFKSKRPDWRNIIEAVDSACKGPFADGSNNLRFLIIEESDKINKIAEFANQTWINEAPVLVVVCSDDTNLENMHGDRGRVYSRQQAGSAVASFLLKLTDLGISSCWVGSFTDELIKQLLKIPSHIQLEALIPIGYESKKEKKKKKKDLEHALFWESWGSSKRPSAMTEAPEPYSISSVS